MRSEKLRVSGIVLRASGNNIEVEISKPEECSGCDSCSCLKPQKIKLKTEKKFQSGDRVFLNILCSNVISLSFLFYLFPALVVLAGFILGYLWKGDLGGFSGAFIFLLIGYICMKKYSAGRYRDIIDIEKE
ncbi:MAG: SoxR reducing system RseC family protein [bacterium]|nr:SoxR reducing system RseC family protein [bacterium]